MVAPILTGILFVAALAVFAFKKPNACRIFLGFFYIAMAIVNIITAIVKPQLYVEYGKSSYLPFYKWLVENVFGKASEVFVLMIAAFQILMGLLILSKGKRVKAGLIGTIVFLVTILPLSVIQIPWLGIAFVQGYLLSKDYDRSFPEIIRSRTRT